MFCGGGKRFDGRYDWSAEREGMGAGKKKPEKKGRAR